MIISLGINEFIRPIGGECIEKVCDYYGGHYEIESLPDTILEVVSTSSIDQLGNYRAGTSQVKVQGTREELKVWADNQPW